MDGIPKTTGVCYDFFFMATQLQRHNAFTVDRHSQKHWFLLFIKRRHRLIEGKPYPDGITENWHVDCAEGT